jgi:hypothetical protein
VSLSVGLAYPLRCFVIVSVMFWCTSFGTVPIAVHTDWNGFTDCGACQGERFGVLEFGSVTSCFALGAPALKFKIKE